MKINSKKKTKADQNNGKPFIEGLTKNQLRQSVSVNAFSLETGKAKGNLMILLETVDGNFVMAELTDKQVNGIVNKHRNFCNSFNG